MAVLMVLMKGLLTVDTMAAMTGAFSAVSSVEWRAAHWAAHWAPVRDDWQAAP